jgi:hypothetical protein
MEYAEILKDFTVTPSMKVTHRLFGMMSEFFFFSFFFFLIKLSDFSLLRLFQILV